MRETRISYQLTLHPDSKAQKAILDLIQASGSKDLLHPLYPFILAQQQTSPILYPLAPSHEISSPVKPLLFDSVIQEQGSFYLTCSAAGFITWREQYTGFVIPGMIQTFDPVEVVDWRGRITLMEITEEDGRIVRYRWDTLHEFHLA